MHQRALFYKQKITEPRFWIFRILHVSAAKIYFVYMLIWTNEIINIEAYRICFSEFFIHYDIIISDQICYCNIMILSKIFYALFLFLPNGDLELMHRLSHVLILTNVKLIHAIIVVLTIFESKFQSLMLRHMWITFMNWMTITMGNGTRSSRLLWRWPI